jgi:ribonucleoside-diphosphate reductase alpha chain
MLKLVNKTVPMALDRLGYSADDIKSICDYIDENETIEGAPKLNTEHEQIFDCAFKPSKGKRFIHYSAHLKMMAAVQPFISGAISKTINMPNESTTEDIAAAYIEGWKLGLKAVAIYRDGSKRLQPVSTKKHKDNMAKASEAAVTARPFRRRLADTRQSITHKFSVAGHEGYLTVGLYYEDGQPGELFITMAKEGSTVGGLMDVIGTCTSMSLQYGVPLITLVDKFRHARFEPAGMTSNRDIPFAKSVIDYIFCWLGCQFLPGYAERNTPNRSAGAEAGQNKNITTARQVVEKTKDLAQKIAEVKAETAAAVKPKAKQQKDAVSPAGKRAAKRFASAMKSDLSERADRAEVLVGSTVSETGGLLQTDEMVMKEFNAQFGHFHDDAPACDICGSVTVRNGTCYRCFNCGNSMGCS